MLSFTILEIRFLVLEISLEKCAQEAKGFHSPHAHKMSRVRFRTQVQKKSNFVSYLLIEILSSKGRFLELFLGVFLLEKEAVLVN